MNWLLATRHVIDIKLPILNALKWCQQCTATHSIRTFKTQVGRQQCRGLGWSYSKTVHLRQMSVSSKPRRLLVAQFCTSRQTFETDEDKKKLADCFKDDPEAREFLKEISRDFNIDHDRDSGRTLTEKIHDDTSSSDGDNEHESDVNSSTPKITEKSEYIIMQDDVVYDYEELDEQYEEIEEPADEVYLPISLERGTTGVFDLSELVELLNYENALDLCTISIPKEIQYVDYMVIVSGRSLKHCQAISAAVKWFFKQKASKRDPKSVKVEGLDGAQWLAVDLGNIALHIFMPKERQKYDLESLWTVGPEFDENVQKELELEGDPFAAYLKDFGHKIDQNETDSIEVRPKTETAKRPYAKLKHLESATDWHNTEHGKF